MMEDNFHFPGLDLPQQFPDLEKLLNWTFLDFLKMAAPAAAPPGPPVTSSSIFGQLKIGINNQTPQKCETPWIYATVNNNNKKYWVS